MSDPIWNSRSTAAYELVQLNQRTVEAQRDKLADRLTAAEAERDAWKAYAIGLERQIDSLIVPSVRKELARQRLVLGLGEKLPPRPDAE